MSVWGKSSPERGRRQFKASKAAADLPGGGTVRVGAGSPVSLLPQSKQEIKVVVLTCSVKVVRGGRSPSSVPCPHQSINTEK